MNTNWQKFEDFLKREGVYKRYWINKELDTSGLLEFDYDKPYGYISEAFIWSATKEGYRFWSEINDMWLLMS